MIPKPRKPDRVPPVGPIRLGGRGNQITVGRKGDKVWLNAFCGAGVTVFLTPDEATELSVALAELAITEPGLPKT